MKQLLSLVLVLFMNGLAQAQDTIHIPFENNLISNAAFNAQVQKDFNFLLFDNLSPAQGISTNADKDGSQILLNGILYSSNGKTIGLNADFSSTSGVYFFDEDAGGKKAAVTLNIFKNYSSFYSYEATPEDLISISLERLDILVKAQSKLDSIFYNLVLHYVPDPDQPIDAGTQRSLKQFQTETIVDSVYSIPELVGSNKVYSQLKDKILELSLEYVNKDTTKGYYRFPIDDIDITLPELTRVEVSKDKTSADYQYSRNFKSLWRKYKAIKTYINVELESEINAAELKNTKDVWSGKHMFFGSIHPFYGREEANILNGNTINKRTGDLYGGKVFPLNYSYEKIKGWPLRFFGRIGLSAARGSNITGSPQTINTIITDGVNPANQPFTITRAESAFTNISAYDYGFRLGFHGEFFLYPSHLPIGLFARLDWQETRFNDTSPGYLKQIPFRTGILYNFKSAKKEKESVVVQVFMDRNNLDKSPNSAAEQWRFGIGLGLPINF